MVSGGERSYLEKRDEADKGTNNLEQKLKVNKRTCLSYPPP